MTVNLLRPLTLQPFVLEKQAEEEFDLLFKEYPESVELALFYSRYVKFMSNDEYSEYRMALRIENLLEIQALESSIEGTDGNQQEGMLDALEDALDVRAIRFDSLSWLIILC